MFDSGFHYATVRERNEQVLASRGMSEQIVQPLLKHAGIEALRDCALDAQTQIESGLLCRIWEVEAMLISTGSVHTTIQDRCLHCLLISSRFVARIMICSKDIVQLLLAFATMPCNWQIQHGVTHYILAPLIQSLPLLGRPTNARNMALMQTIGPTLTC